MTGTSSNWKHIHRYLSDLYGEGAADVEKQLAALLDDFRGRIAPPYNAVQPLTEKDAILITYGDQVKEAGKPPLQTLREILVRYARNIITAVHILPFFPYSSDDGFAIIDYQAVNPAWGTWADVTQLGQHFRLMFDGVINHISSQSRWFQEFLLGNPQFQNYFITVPDEVDLSQVVRPRALPLLTPVQTALGEKKVWTTFSADQIDLNYANPAVLLQMISTLLFYVEKGASIIRLDAIAYLWKKIGTPCIHLKETHEVVKLLRAVLNEIAPHVLLITETNVPHDENVSYFGNGHDEAQLVYQFPLPPLVLHAFLSQDATRLANWADNLSTPSAETTFFNFLASHDGIGIRPVEGILSASEMQALIDRTLAHGGYVSYKTNSDGSQSAYELNISYFDALSDPDGDEPLALQVRRFLSAQAIMLSLAGVPGIYVHSFFGSRSDREAVERTGQYRAINRGRFQRADLERALQMPETLRHQVYHGNLRLLKARSAHPAFHPQSPQRVHYLHPEVFVLERVSLDGRKRVLCLHNVSNHDVTFTLPDIDTWQDLITGERGAGSVLTLKPVQTRWLT